MFSNHEFYLNIYMYRYFIALNTIQFRKMKSTKSLIFSIHIAFLLLFIFFSGTLIIEKTTYKASSQQIIEEFDKIRNSDSWTLPNIYITNWSIVNMTYDWCNYEDGYYIIENITITGVNGKNGIHIENTTENFIIRNCKINEGVVLIRVSNGHVVNNSIYFGQAYPTHTVTKIGIYMGHCLNSSIENNFIKDITDWLASAIMLYVCNDITIRGNTISNYDYFGFISSIGLDIQASEKIRAINNTILDSDSGISSSQSYLCRLNENRITNCIRGIRGGGSNHTIANNTIKDSREYGINSIGNNNSIISNKLYNGGTGIIAKASYSIFSNNTIQNYIEYGFYFEESNHNTISSNSIQHDVNIGIYLENSNHSSITENYIKYKIACISEVNCYGNNITDNICINISEPPYAYYFFFLVLGAVIIATIIIAVVKIKKKK